MSLLEIIILAIVQGVTEFLPVSSSGHLVTANFILEQLGHGKTKDLIEVSIALHLGTLLSVLVYYWKDILRLLGKDRRVIGLLIAGTIPATVIGLPLKLFFPEILENVLLAGCMFPVTAVLLIFAMRHQPGKGEYTSLSLKSAFGIGLLQAFALLPGISRSGSTIAAGLFSGLKRESAATFAFLLAIPAIAGAGVIEMAKIIKEGSTGTAMSLLAGGFTISFVVGYISLWLLIRFVQKGRLAIFAWYLIPLGVAVVAWKLFASM